MLNRFLRNTRGTIAVAAGIVLPVAVGFLGLGAEVSYWYFNQRKVQSATDAAAYAAAVQYRMGASQSAMETGGLDAATKSGFETGIGSSVFSAPPASGPFTGDTAVEVVLTEQVPRLFTAVFVNGAVPMSSRAVARILPARPACILALDPSAPGAVTFTGSSDALLENCDVAANSLDPAAITISGGGQLETDCMATVGGVSVSGSSSLTMNECDAAAENTHVFDDPYAGVPDPSTSGPCAGQNTFSGPPGAVHDVSPGRFCGGMQVNRTVNLDPGVYVIDGGSLSISSTASLRGTGVTFYLTNGADLNINGTADVQISAPTSGPYAGLAIFADADNDTSLEYNINGDSDSFIAGAIYSPSGTVVINGSSTAGGGCTQVVARMVRVAGGTGFGSDCTGAGTNPLLSVRPIRLVE